MHWCVCVYPSPITITDRLVFTVHLSVFKCLSLSFINVVINACIYILVRCNLYEFIVHGFVPIFVYTLILLSIH